MLLIGRFVQEQLQVLSSIIKIEVTKFTFLNVVFFPAELNAIWTPMEQTEKMDLKVSLLNLQRNFLQVLRLHLSLYLSLNIFILSISSQMGS